MPVYKFVYGSGRVRQYCVVKASNKFQARGRLIDSLRTTCKFSEELISELMNKHPLTTIRGSGTKTKKSPPDKEV